MKTMQHSVIVPFSCGKPRFNMFIEERDKRITQIHFCGAGSRERVNPSALISEAVKQLTEYFSGTRKIFDLPVHPAGTEFQQKVWNELLRIPYGQTVSYGQIAANIANPKASRAVGGANHCNPVSVVIPCHRVIGANGQLTGYGGGLEMKKMLLDLERNNLR
jgi:methylated-DNA-[protein]-cysteine S-methyltransferase